MKKVVSLLLVIVFALSLASCKGDLTTKISKDGKISVDTCVYFTESEYATLMSANGGGESVTKNEDAKIEDVVIDGVKYKKITQQTKVYDNAEKYKEETLEDPSAIITPNKVKFTFSKSGSGDSNASQDPNYNFDDSLTSLIASGVNVTMTFVMPYKIKDTNGEKVDDYTVRFNVMQTNEKATFYVTAEEGSIFENAIWFIVLGLVILLSICALVLFVPKRKKKENEYESELDNKYATESEEALENEPKEYFNDESENRSEDE